MSETLAAAPPPNNAPEAREATGELKNQASTTVTVGTTPEPKPEPKVEPKVEPKTEGKAEAKPSEDKSLLNDKKEPGPLTGAPESYTDFAAPEGFEIDKAAIADALPIFKKLNLSQAGAQEIVDFYAKTSQEAAKAPLELWKTTQAKWIDEVKADPEIGGKLDQVKATVARAIDGLGDAKLANDFRQAMDYTGAGNNPAFIRAFYKLAQKVTEGTAVSGNKPSPAGQVAPGGAPKSIASALFPNLK